MNNVHDMGGQQGYGAIPIEKDEPVFHEEWEARAMALTLAMAAWGKWNIDASRHAREKLSPRDYLNFTYYERWIAALADLMAETGLVSLEELASGKPDPGTPKETPPLKPEMVSPILRKGGPSERAVEAAPRFSPGQRVRTSTASPKGHTRLPLYARGRTGEVLLLHGAHVLPDSNAHFRGESPQHLYAVRFSARELWGPEAAPKDSVTLDLWESYLEPA